MSIHHQRITITAAGVDGSATGSGTTSQTVNGMVERLYWTFPAAVSTTIVLATAETPASTIQSTAAVAASTAYFPRGAVCSTAGVGAAAGDNKWDKISVSSFITATVSLTNAGTFYCDIWYSDC